jgi:hypothetical protein
VVVVDRLHSLSKQWRDAADGRKSICAAPNENLEVGLFSIDVPEWMLHAVMLMLPAVDRSHRIVAF